MNTDAQSSRALVPPFCSDHASGGPSPGAQTDRVGVTDPRPSCVVTLSQHLPGRAEALSKVCKRWAPYLLACLLLCARLFNCRSAQFGTSVGGVLIGSPAATHAGLGSA